MKQLWPTFSNDRIETQDSLVERLTQQALRQADANQAALQKAKAEQAKREREESRKVREVTR